MAGQGLRKKARTNLMRTTEKNILYYLRILYPGAYISANKDGIRDSEPDIDGTPYWVEVSIVDWYMSENVRRKLVDDALSHSDGRSVMSCYRLYCPMYNVLMPSRIILKYDNELLFEFKNLVYDREVIFFIVDGVLYTDMSTVCFLRSIRNNEACRVKGNWEADQRIKRVERTNKARLSKGDVNKP